MYMIYFASLPPELALIENLKQLLITGNPLRTIRKDILTVRPNKFI